MTQNYEVPKLETPVEICLINSETLRGKIFLTKDAQAPGGTSTIELLLTKETGRFIPFLSDAGTHRLINKNQIIFIRTYQSDEEIRARTSLEPKTLVVYFSNKQSMFGIIYPTLVEESRVTDILNEGGQFIAIYHEEQKIVVNLDHIIYASSN